MTPGLTNDSPAQKASSPSVSPDVSSGCHQGKQCSHLASSHLINCRNRRHCPAARSANATERPGQVPGVQMPLRGQGTEAAAAALRAPGAARHSSPCRWPAPSSAALLGQQESPRLLREAPAHRSRAGSQLRLPGRLLHVRGRSQMQRRSRSGLQPGGSLLQPSPSGLPDLNKCSQSENPKGF